jgi:alpha-galactosidase
VRVGGGERYFFNMKNAAVREYLTQKVAAIYNMGVRYIKNDFNAALRWTSDADVINENQRYAMQFYSELNEKFPDLYVENCGSGGMRADYGMLKNFCIQSTSDQEIYYYYPSIAQGMLANILPEHAGIWSFPYPNLFDLRSDEIAMEREAERCANGRQTVFNMVTAIAGNLYLSGRIDYADDFNSALIAEGIEQSWGLNDSLKDGEGLIQEANIKNVLVLEEGDFDPVNKRIGDTLMVHTVIKVKIKPVIFASLLKDKSEFEFHTDLHIDKIIL